MKKLALVFALVAVGFTATAQKQEVTLKDNISGEVKTIKVSNRLVEDLKQYGRVTNLRGVFTYEDGKITMVNRRGNTTKQGNSYVYYRENIFFNQI
jgi:hypothetical protein|tara:strand:+ start:2556 stop:2843 length:288 start_codon:yes stop_codon:yes gene_type:complete